MSFVFQTGSQFIVVAGTVIDHCFTQCLDPMARVGQAVHASARVFEQHHVSNLMGRGHVRQHMHIVVSWIFPN